jgi:hypothetical protein
MRPIDLHIEELVLDGFPPGDRHRIGAALERELTRLLAERGVPAGWERGGEAPQLNGGSFEAKPGARPERVGAQIAQSVFRGMGK